MTTELKKKRQRDRFVGDWEADEALSYRVNRRISRLWPQSKVAGGLSRRNQDEDRIIFQALQGALGRGERVVLGRGRRPAVLKDIGLLIKPEDEDTPAGTTTVWTSDWTHTGERLKLFSYGAAMMEGGPLHTLNLNLGETVQREALRSRRGVAGYLSERISRHLKKAGEPSPSYAFLIEASPVHDMHVHGLIQSNQNAASLRAALKAAGGECLGKPHERQVHLKPVWSLEGWVAYIAKATFTTAREVRRLKTRETGEASRTMLIGATQGVRRAGAAWYRNMRRTGDPIV